MSTKPGPNSDIPKRANFKIGEVAQLVGVRAHVLRYWEKEIATVRPGKSEAGQRRYRTRDIQMFREIRRLLHDERYTLAGVRQVLRGQAPVGALLSGDKVSKVRAGLLELLALAEA